MGIPPGPSSKSPSNASSATELVSPTAVRRFRVVSKIGMGSFGVVHQASVWGTTQSCAMKTISKEGRTLDEVNILKREIKISRGLSHIGIVLTVWAFETAACLVVVQERALGDLYRVLKDDRRLPETLVKDIGRQLVSALEHIHSKGIIHRDLKPQNILVLSGGRVALCDFGFARAVSANTAMLKTIKGTPLYMAPEVVQELPYNHTADLWSLGVILYELYEGRPPFWGDSLVALMRMVVRKPFSMPSGISTEFASFLNMTLDKDPVRRINWPYLSSHPFIALSAVEEASMVFSNDCSHLQQQQNMRFEDVGRARLAGLFRPRVVPRGQFQIPQKPAEEGEEELDAGEEDEATKASRPRALSSNLVALPPPLPPVVRSTSTSVTGDQNEEVAKVVKQLGAMMPLTRTESTTSSTASPPLPRPPSSGSLTVSRLALSSETEEASEEERMAIKELMERLFYLHATDRTLPSEEEILTCLRTFQSKSAFLAKLIERLEASKSSKRWETVQIATRVIRRFVRQGVPTPQDTVRVIVSYLIADEDPRVCVQGLKCLDTILSKDQSAVLSYILKPTYTPRLVEVPLVPLLLDCFHKEKEVRVLRAATHVSLSLLSIPSGWRISRLFTQHMTPQVLEIFLGMLVVVEPEAVPDGIGEDDMVETRTEMLRIVSRLCACPSGMLSRTIANSSKMRESIERLAFDATSQVQNWPAISVLEYLCRFGSPPKQKRLEWVGLAMVKTQTLVDDLEAAASQTSSSSTMTTTTTTTLDTIFNAVNASLRVVMEASAPLSPWSLRHRLDTASTATMDEVAKTVIRVIQLCSAVHPLADRDLETFFAFLHFADKAAWCQSRLEWDAVWKTTRHPNETLHALAVRTSALQSAGFPLNARSLVEKLPVLINEAMSKRFIGSVEQYPKSLGGGRFGARMIVRSSLELIETALGKSPRPQDALLFLQQFYDLEGTRVLTAHVQRYMEEDSKIVAMYARIIVSLMRINVSKSSRGMMEISGIADVLIKILEVDPRSGLRIFSGWSRTGGSAFELCLPADAMAAVIAQLTRYLRAIEADTRGSDDLVSAKGNDGDDGKLVVDDSKNGETPSSSEVDQSQNREDVRDICAAVGNMCRRSGRHSADLEPLFIALGDVLLHSGLFAGKQQIMDDALSLAVGNAAFHSNVLYPVLARFVPVLIQVIEDVSAEPKTRANAALAIGNLLRHGDANDALLAESTACGALLRACRLSRDLLERRVVLLSLGNFAGRPLCRAVLRDKYADELKELVEESLADDDAEVKTAAMRISEKMQQMH